MEIRLLSKEYEDEWTEYINKQPYSDVYHSLTWRDVISKSYGYEPKYYIALDSNKITGIMPLFLIKKIFGDTKLSSGPFAQYSYILTDNNLVTEALISNAIEEAKRFKVRYLELKPVKKIDEGVSTKLGLVEVKPYKLTTLKLNAYDVLKMGFAAGLRRNLKRNQKKMESQNLSFHFDNNEKDLMALYDLILNEYKNKFGVPCGPYKTFKIIYQLFGGDHKIFTVKNEKGKIVAGIIFVTFNKNITPLYLTTHSDYLKLALPMLLIGKVLKWGCDNNLRSYSLGISSPSQESLIFFKELWGGVTEDVHYYYYPVSGTIPKNFDFGSDQSQLRRICRWLPSPLIKLILPPVAKQLG